MIFSNDMGDLEVKLRIESFDMDSDPFTDPNEHCM